MAINPIIHGKNGINRFRDYASSLPGFLRNEDDVVELVQFFSDYINNAYRNIELATQFRFKRIVLESNVGYVINELDRLVKLFQVAEAKESSILYLTKDTSSAITMYLDIDVSTEVPSSILSGAISNINVTGVITTTLPHNISLENNVGKNIKIDSTTYEISEVTDSTNFTIISPPLSGTTFEIEVTDTSLIHSDEIVYNVINNVFVVNTSGVTYDNISTSQDPFTRSLNDTMISVFGDVPRMIEFDVRDISDVRYRRLRNDDGSVSNRFEVYFDCRIDNVHDELSVDVVNNESEYKYIVDYYKSLSIYDTNLYTAKHSINFTDTGFNELGNALSNGIFYVRDITKNDKIYGDVNLEGINKYTDPYLYESFSGNYPGEWKGNTAYLKGDYIRYNGIRYVSTSDHTSTYNSQPGVSSLYRVFIELWHSKSIVDQGSTDIEYLVSYKNAVFNFDFTSFMVGDIIYRYELSSPVSSCRATIKEINEGDSTLILTDIVGDVLSNGKFIVLSECGIINKEAEFYMNITLWDKYSTSIYKVGEYYLYNNLRYTVIKSNIPSDKDSEYNPMISSDYILDMSSIYFKKYTTDYNPYMWSGYRVISQKFGEVVSSEYDIHNIGEQLYIEQVEELSLNIKHDQRKWLLNPTLARNTDASRNGFMSVTQLSFDDGLGNISYTSNDIVTASVDTKIKQGDIILAKQNLFDISDDNPEIATSDYYQYNISGIVDQQSTSNYDSTIFNTKVHKNALIKYDIDNNIATYNEHRNVELSTKLPSNYYFDGVNSVYITSDDIRLITQINGDGAIPNIVTVTTATPHSLSIGDQVDLKLTDQYDETTIVLGVPNTTEFTYESVFNNTNIINKGIVALNTVQHKLSTGDHISTESTSTNFDYNNISISEYDSSTLQYKITDGSTPGSVIDYGEYSVFVNLNDGDIVNLTAQTESNENGKYRIVRNTDWTRLDKKLHIKISDLDIEHDVLEDYDEDFDSSPLIYKNITIADVIASGKTYYVIEYPLVNSFKFDRPVISNIDTTKNSFHEYNAKFDTNTIADRSDMDVSFKGIPDMGASLSEKIERLSYQKDPSIIDFELIGYLGKFMGYDITNLSSDITDSVLFNSDSEREEAVRMAIRSLPQYYTLKNTESGLEMILLMFGIVGEVINLWTDNSDPYREFIPDYSVDTHRYKKMLNGENVNLVATPHFNYKIEIGSNFTNELSINDIKRINERITKYKPINTVFDGVIAYLNQAVNVTIDVTGFELSGRMVSDIGYDIDFSEKLDNSCI